MVFKWPINTLQTAILQPNISNIRLLRLRKVKTIGNNDFNKYWTELCRLQLFHHDFWKENNLNYLNSLHKVDQSNSEALSAFYKIYTQQSKKSFDSYSKACWKKNISLISLGYRECFLKIRSLLLLPFSKATKTVES